MCSVSLAVYMIGTDWFKSQWKVNYIQTDGCFHRVHLPTQLFPTHRFETTETLTILPK